MVLQPEFIRNRQLWIRKGTGYGDDSFTASRNFWMNTIKSADLSSYYRLGDPKNPFIRKTTKKIRRQDVLIDYKYNKNPFE